jgi:hypothetical protein
MNKREKAAPLSPRVYELLLWSYPAGFRAEFGREMRQVFSDRCREAARGGSGLLRLWGDTLLDLARTAPREHAEKFAAGGRLMKTLRTIVLALAAYAFALLVAAPLYVRHREEMPAFVASLADALIATGVLFNFIFLVVSLPRFAEGVRAVRLAGLLTALVVAGLIALIALTGGAAAFPNVSVMVAQVVSFSVWYAAHLWWVLRRTPAGPPAHA